MIRVNLCLSVSHFAFGVTTSLEHIKSHKFLEVAVAGKADVIVSGDEDLLVLHPFRGIPIVGPAQFMEMLAGEDQPRE